MWPTLPHGKVKSAVIDSTQQHDAGVLTACSSLARGDMTLHKVSICSVAGKPGKSSNSVSFIFKLRYFVLSLGGRGWKIHCGLTLGNERGSAISLKTAIKALFPRANSWRL